MLNEKAVARAIAREMHKGGDFGMDGDRAYEERPAEFLALARAAITALRPGSTGDLVIVPKEPTGAMVDCIHDDAEVARHRYRAMLAAAGGRDE